MINGMVLEMNKVPLTVNVDPILKKSLEDFIKDNGYERDEFIVSAMLGLVDHIDKGRPHVKVVAS